MELTGRTIVRRPIAEVFAAWLRIDRAVEYLPMARHRGRLDDGAVGPGTRFEAVDRWPGMDVAYRIEITAVQPHERVAATLSDPLSGGWDAIFEPAGDATEVRLHWSISPAGRYGLVAPFLRPWFSRQAAATVAAFGTWVESGATEAD